MEQDKSYGDSFTIEKDNEIICLLLNINGIQAEG